MILPRIGGLHTAIAASICLSVSAGCRPAASTATSDARPSGAREAQEWLVEGERRLDAIRYLGTCGEEGVEPLLSVIVDPAASLEEHLLAIEGLTAIGLPARPFVERLRESWESQCRSRERRHARANSALMIDNPAAADRADRAFEQTMEPFYRTLGRLDLLLQRLPEGPTGADGEQVDRSVRDLLAPLSDEPVSPTRPSMERTDRNREACGTARWRAELANADELVPEAWRLAVHRERNAESLETQEDPDAAAVAWIEARDSFRSAHAAALVVQMRERREAWPFPELPFSGVVDRMPITPHVEFVINHDNSAVWLWWMIEDPDNLPAWAAEEGLHIEARAFDPHTAEGARRLLRLRREMALLGELDQVHFALTGAPYLFQPADNSRSYPSFSEAIRAWISTQQPILRALDAAQ